MATSTASVRTEKSTNVRTEKMRATLRLHRLGFRLLGAGVPSIASRVAERLFFTARRHPRPAWEHELLDRARHVFVPHGPGLLPVWSWGQGPIVLLVHGWEGRGAQLGMMVEPLVEAGFRVVTFDGPGHGDTQLWRASVPDMAEAIASVVREIGTPHTIVAHSMGALATTLALSRGVSAQKVVMVAPATDPRGYAAAFANAFGLSDEVRDEMVARIEERFGIRLDTLYGPSIAERFAMPMHAFHDTDDHEVPIANGRELVAAWSGSALTATRGLGHRRILRDAAVIADTVAFVCGREMRGEDSPLRAHTPDPSELDRLGFAVARH